MSFALAELLLLLCLLGSLALLHLHAQADEEVGLPPPLDLEAVERELAELQRRRREAEVDAWREVALPLAQEIDWRLWLARRDQLERRPDRIVLPLLDERFEAAIELAPGWSCVPRPWRLGPAATNALERLLPAALRREVLVEPGRIVHRQPVPPTLAQRAELAADLGVIARLLLEGPEAVERPAVAVRPGAGPSRCAFCRGDLDHDATRCAGCATALHADCRAELRRCPTAGCDERRRAA